MKSFRSNSLRFDKNFDENVGRETVSSSPDKIRAKQVRVRLLKTSFSDYRFSVPINRPEEILWSWPTSFGWWNLTRTWNIDLKLDENDSRVGWQVGNILFPLLSFLEYATLTVHSWTDFCLSQEEASLRNRADGSSAYSSRRKWRRAVILGSSFSCCKHEVPPFSLEKSGCDVLSNLEELSRWITNEEIKVGFLSVLSLSAS